MGCRTDGIGVPRTCQTRQAMIVNPWPGARARRRFAQSSKSITKLLVNAFVGRARRRANHAC